MAIDNRKPLPDLIGSGTGRQAPGADEVLRLDDLHVSVHDGTATTAHSPAIGARCARRKQTARSMQFDMLRGTSGTATRSNPNSRRLDIA